MCGQGLGKWRACLYDTHDINLFKVDSFYSSDTILILNPAFAVIFFIILICFKLNLLSKVSTTDRLGNNELFIEI